MAQLKQREQIRPSLAFLFYLDPQRLGSFRDTLTYTSRNHVSPALWASLSTPAPPTKLTH